MQLPKNTTVAVTDGTKISLFQTASESADTKLTALPAVDIAEGHAGSGARHQNSAANPSHGQLEEDDFSASVAKILNARVESGSIKHLYIIAAPKALGEIRKHYTKRTSEILVGELAKDLTGHTTADIEKSIAAAH